MRVTSKKIFPRRVSICIFKTEEKAEDYGFSRILTFRIFVIASCRVVGLQGETNQSIRTP